MARAWQRVLCAVALGGLILTLSVSTHADVENKTPYDFWVKPEDGVNPIYVPRGQKHKGKQDGLAVPARFPNKVFKVIDSCIAIMREDDIYPDCALGTQTIQYFWGGWKDAKWIEEHPDWKPLFAHSR